MIWNPHAFTILGQPIAPAAPPVLHVMGGQQASAAQMSMAQAIFARFCDETRASFVPNPSETGYLADGTAYEISVIGNSSVMEIWPVSVNTPGMTGIAFTLSGSEHQDELGNALVYLLSPEAIKGSRLTTGRWRMRKIAREDAVGGLVARADAVGSAYVTSMNGDGINPGIFDTTYFPDSATVRPSSSIWPDYSTSMGWTGISYIKHDGSYLGHKRPAWGNGSGGGFVHTDANGGKHVIFVDFDYAPGSHGGEISIRSIANKFEGDAQAGGRERSIPLGPDIAPLTFSFTVSADGSSGLFYANTYMPYAPQGEKYHLYLFEAKFTSLGLVSCKIIRSIKTDYWSEPAISIPLPDPESSTDSGSGEGYEYIHRITNQPTMLEVPDYAIYQLHSGRIEKYDFFDRRGKRRTGEINHSIRTDGEGSIEGTTVSNYDIAGALTTSEDSCSGSTSKSYLTVRAGDPRYGEAETEYALETYEINAWGKSSRVGGGETSYDFGGGGQHQSSTRRENIRAVVFDDVTLDFFVSLVYGYERKIHSVFSMLAAGRYMAPNWGAGEEGVVEYSDETKREYKLEFSYKGGIFHTVALPDMYELQRLRPDPGAPMPNDESMFAPRWAYDPRTGALLVSIVYRGRNPDLLPNKQWDIAVDDTRAVFLQSLFPAEIGDAAVRPGQILMSV